MLSAKRDSRYSKRFILFVSFSFLLVGNHLSAQRVCCEGDLWLKWKPDIRQAYVTGWVLGYSHAYIDGCEHGVKNWPNRSKLSLDDDPLKRCLAAQLDFSRGTDYFLKAVTDFYKRYPSDRDIYVVEVLEQLGKGLTLEQIHEYPFMRHHPQPTKKQIRRQRDPN